MGGHKILFFGPKMKMKMIVEPKNYFLYLNIDIKNIGTLILIFAKIKVQLTIN